jgi:broad specificity phosphatase PhoE
MGQLSTNDLEFLRRFARTPEGKALVELFQRNLAESDVKLRTTIGDELLRTQGRAQLLAELIDQVTKAEVTLSRATQRRPIAPSDWETADTSARQR